MRNLTQEQQDFAIAKILHEATPEQRLGIVAVLERGLLVTKQALTQAKDEGHKTFFRQEIATIEKMLKDLT